MHNRKTLRQRVIDRLKIDEGCRKFPYDDATGKSLVSGDIVRGKITVGIGRNLQDKPLADHEIHYLLNTDLSEIEEQAEGFWWYEDLSEPRKLVIISMIFNMGLTRFRGFAKTIDYLEERKYNEAADEMLDSRWANQVGDRARRLSAIMKYNKFEVEIT